MNVNYNKLQYDNNVPLNFVFTAGHVSPHIYETSRGLWEDAMQLWWNTIAKWRNS